MSRLRSLPNALVMERVIYGLISVVLLSIIYLSFTLKPNPKGFATHTMNRIGSECTMIRMFDVPCPFCGMTTSFTNMSRANFIEAFRVNLFGPLLYIGFIIALSLTLYGCLSNKRVYLLVLTQRFNLWLDFGIAILAISYAYRIAIYLLLFRC